MIVRAPRVPRRRLRRDAARAEAPPGAGRAVGGRPRPLPDRALRRDEAARRDGALDPARPVAPDRRRAHLRARRLDPAGRRGDARRVPRPRLREEHDRDHARPRDPLPDRRHDPGHVRRQARREGAGGARSSTTRAIRTRSCCSARCPRSARASPRSRSAASPAGRRRCSTRRRAAGSGTAARSPSRSASRSRRSSRSSPAATPRAGRWPPDARARPRHEGLQDRHVRRQAHHRGLRRLASRSGPARSSR